MECNIHIDMDNAAFEDEPASELARLLRYVAIRVEEGEDDFPVSDINGNRVGWFKITS